MLNSKHIRPIIDTLGPRPNVQALEHLMSMPEIEPQTLAEQAVLLGLVTQDQAREVMDNAENGELQTICRAFLRRGYLTSWQVEKLLKGDLSGFYFGGCKVLFHLAEGTFARVYRGIKTPGDESVAIKVLRQRFSNDPGSIERFNKEAEAGMRLIHPNIVRVYNFGESDKRHYMIMEYVEGSNLREFLKRRKRLTVREALPLMLGLARALQYSLAAGITHRDIKGTNILISNTGVAKLVDFGLATIGGDEKVMAAAHGQRTVDYAALERTCNSPKGDPRSDIYFLGCVFYQMVTGQLPLKEVEAKDPLEKMLKRSFGAIKPLSEQRHAPPEELTQIIERMMQIDLKKRYQDMDAVVADLERFQAHLEEPPKPAAAQVERKGYYDPVLGSHEDIFLRPAFSSEPAAPPKSILCVEMQEATREVFRKTLSGMGYRVLLVGDAERAAERYRESPTDAVIFDTDGQGEQALEAFLVLHEKAHEDGHDLVAVVILGPKHRDLENRLPTDDRLIILKKPIKMKDVQDALAQLLPVSN
jgi:tRNA A-37 threonylcarbamoyl transferase component Bud32